MFSIKNWNSDTVRISGIPRTIKEYPMEAPSFTVEIESESQTIVILDFLQELQWKS